MVNLLLEHNAKIDHVDFTGATALHAAVHSGSTSIAETLLDAGADINHRDTVASMLAKPYSPLFFLLLPPHSPTLLFFSLVSTPQPGICNGFFFL